LAASTQAHVVNVVENSCFALARGAGVAGRVRGKFVTRQPPIGEKDDHNCENSWILDGLPSSSRRRRRGEVRGEGGEWREKWSASKLTLVDCTKSEIKVQRSCDPG